MRNKITFIAIVLVIVLGLGVANIIYAQGPDDGDPATPTPCELHAMMHTEDCPFANEDGLQLDWMHVVGI